MIKKSVIVAFALILLFCITPIASPALGTKAFADGENLVVNGTFEDNDGENAASWATNCWDNEEGFTTFSIDPAGGADGGAAVCIENNEVNDARFTQNVQVKKGALYRLSGDIRVEGADGTWGATLSFKDTFTYTEPLFDTDGEWKYVEVYARAGSGQTETTVFVRLGGYGSTCHGKAWFDNVRLEEVEGVPEGMTAMSMATNKPSGSGGSNNSEGKYLPYIIVTVFAFVAFLFWALKRLNEGGGITGEKWHVGLYLIGAIVVGAAYPALQLIAGEYADASGKVLEAANVDLLLCVVCVVGFGFIPALVSLLVKTWLPEKHRRWMDIAFIGYVALAVRVALALTVRGYPNDIDCWLGWSGQAASGRFMANLFSIYSTSGFNDYPPGYMYVLWLVGKINSLVPVVKFQVLMVKLPSIAADIATAWFIYRIACSRAGERVGLLLGLLYVFNPLVLLDSSAWGQIDSILALIAVSCFWQVYRGRMGWAAVLYGIGLLVKPQMLLFGPVMLAALVNACRKSGSAENGLYVALKTLGAGLATVVLLALPFWIVQVNQALAIPAEMRGSALHEALLWLPNQYLDSMGTYKNASINACNLMAFFGGNWADDAAPLFGLPYAVWGWAGIVLVSVYVFCMQLLRDRDNKRIFLWAAVLVTGVFVLGIRMHERYMYPVVALLLMYYAVARDRRALHLFGMFTLTQFMNAAITLANGHMSSDTLPLGPFSIANPGTFGIWVLIISLAAVAAFIYMVYASARAGSPLLGEYTDAETVAAEKNERIRTDLAMAPEASRIPMKRKDWLVMGALTAVYAVLSLVYLGDVKVPQSMWPALRTGDYVVVDFGRQVEVGQVWHYDSLTKGNLSVSSSQDGHFWTDELDFRHKAVESGEHDDLGIYKWTIDYTGFSARYVKLAVTLPPVRLLEIAFKDPAGNLITDMEISDAGGAEDSGADESVARAGAAIDEQDRLPSRPSFMNSMYFDEIYHARTGWEFTQGNLTPYETTHPPLGKDLIALGIWIFGMNPFGWRFMGTLMGILMVPAMYLFGMAVFKRTRWAFITAFLFTFDFMHFVQTRIATIDSYSVLFIILTFLCMYLYLNTNFNSQKLGRTLLPLAFSGVFFGLASASKWIGMYAGLGLAFMFFYALYRRAREYISVRRGDVEMDDEARERLLTGFGWKVAATLGWCVLFFIVIPAAIYFASYIPFDRGMSGGKAGVLDGLSYAWQNQSSMFRYHSQLVDSHYFRSPWYQWPIMIRPMWFYQAPDLPPGQIGAISTFGNPAVWWPGTAALVWLVIRIFKSRRFELPETFMLAGFLTEFLPWVLVPRTMFIYHYFASVPFFTMAIVLYIRRWEQRRAPADKNAQLQVIIALAAAVFVTVIAGFVGFSSMMLPLLVAYPLVILLAMYMRGDPLELYRRDLTHIYLAMVLALFILFYPVLSGLPIPLWYERLLKWMPTWIFTNMAGG